MPKRPVTTNYRFNLDDDEGGEDTGFPMSAFSSEMRPKTSTFKSKRHTEIPTRRGGEYVPLASYIKGGHL